jgi:nitronate monooxygenase
MRAFYSLRSLLQLKSASLEGTSYRDYFQAGRSVETIDRVEPVAVVMERFAEALGSFEALTS